MLLGWIPTNTKADRVNLQAKCGRGTQFWHEEGFCCSRQGIRLFRADRGRRKASVYAVSCRNSISCKRELGNAFTCAGSGAAMVEFAAEESARTCPICLDEASRQTITVCGHHFCSDCIHEYVPSHLPTQSPIQVSVEVCDSTQECGQHPGFVTSIQTFVQGPDD